MDRKKIVHRLDTPYSAVEWLVFFFFFFFPQAKELSPLFMIHLLTHVSRPQISQDNQDVILELLCRYVEFHLVYPFLITFPCNRPAMQ
jgi:hypothetical protein